MEVLVRAYHRTSHRPWRLPKGLAKMDEAWIMPATVLARRAPVRRRRAAGRAYAPWRHAPTRQQDAAHRRRARSEEHTSELQSLMRISYAVFRLKKKPTTQIVSHTI